VIFRLNVISAAGNRIYDKALERFKVQENRIGVPALIIGETFLVGTDEIPEKFPGLIAAALSKGGLDLPNLPVYMNSLSYRATSTWKSFLHGSLCL